MPFEAGKNKSMRENKKRKREVNSFGALNEGSNHSGLKDFWVLTSPVGQGKKHAQLKDYNSPSQAKALMAKINLRKFRALHSR